MSAMVIGAIHAINWVILVYFGLINLMYGINAILAARTMHRYVPRLGTFDALERAVVSAAPPITVFAPAFNEGNTCVESVRSLLALDYPEHEIIVINDGSTDATLPNLISAFDLAQGARAPTAEIETALVRAVYQSRLHPNLWVVDKENGGKADALNAAINFCCTPLFCAMDADSILERDALMRIVQPFLEEGSTVAAGGMIRAVNDCPVDSGIVTQVRLPERLLARFQVLEYLRSFLLGRVGWAAMGASLVISGAFGLFKRSTVVAAGGYASRRTSGETVGEDMELVVRLKRYCHEAKLKCSVAFVPDAVAWTEVPEDLSTLGRQRDRWQRGLYESLTRHRTMLFNPSYGLTGLVSFPHFFFLEMIGPVLEFVGYVAFTVSVLLGIVSTSYVIAFFTMSIALGVVISLAAVVVEEYSFHRYKSAREVVALFGLAVIENFGFRQLTVYWRFRGLIRLLGGRTSWGDMERRGFTSSTAPRPERLAPSARVPQKTQVSASVAETYR